MPGPKYTTGQRVEVLAFDLETPGTPEVWLPGAVTAVDPTDSGRWVVKVAQDNGRVEWQIVGKHGGSKHIRALRHPAPLGSVIVDYEWSTRDSGGLGWVAADETEARDRLTGHPEWTLHRRVRWVSYGEFEDVL